MEILEEGRNDSVPVSDVRQRSADVGARRKQARRKNLKMRGNSLIRRHLGRTGLSRFRRDPARKVGMGLLSLAVNKKYIESLTKVKRKLELIKKRYRAEITLQNKRLISLKREVALLELILNNREPIKAFFKTLCNNSVRPPYPVMRRDRRMMDMGYCHLTHGSSSLDQPNSTQDIVLL